MWIQRVIAMGLLYLTGLMIVTAEPAAALVAAIALTLAAIVRLALVRAGSLDIVALTVALGLVLWDQEHTTAPPAGALHLAFLMELILVTAVAALWPPARAAAYVVLSGIGYAVVNTGTLPAQDLVLELLVCATTAAGVAASCTAFREAGRRSDAAAEEATEVFGRRAANLAEEAADRETRRLLHDHLIASLAVVQHRPGRATVETAAAEALERLDDFTSRHPAIPDLQVPTHGIEVTVDDRREGPADEIPRRVWEAVVDAAREALRNTARHARVERARVVVSGDQDDLVLEVVDDGSGFDPESPPGFGLSNSVIERMREVGGVAEVTSRPGAGTTVRLAWTRSASVPEPTNRWSELRQALGDPRPLLVWFPSLHLFSQSAIMLSYPGPHPVASTALGLTVLVASIALMQRATRGPLDLPVTCAAVVLPPVAVALGLWLEGSGALVDFQSWIVAMSCVPLVILALVGPRWSIWTSTALMSATVLAAAVADPAVAPAQVVGPVVQPLLYGGLFAFTAHTIKMVGAVANRAHEDTLEALLADARSTFRRQVLQRRLGGLDQQVRDLLEGIVDGTLDPGDDRVVAEAVLLAQKLRDELLAPDVLNDRSRARLAEVRQAGGSVILREGIDPACEEALAAALEALPLGSSEAPLRMVIAPDPDHHGAALLTWRQGESGVAGQRTAAPAVNRPDGPRPGLG